MTAEVLSVQRAYRRFRAGGVHIGEPEPSWATRVSVRDDLDGLDLPVCLEEFFEFVLGCGERQIPNVKSLGQLRSPLRLYRCDHPTLHAEDSDSPVCRSDSSDTDNRPRRKGFSRLAGRTGKAALSGNTNRGQTRDV